MSIFVILNLLAWCVLLGLAYWLITMLPLPSPFPTIIKVIFVLLALFVLFGLFGFGGVSLPTLVRG